MRALTLLRTAAIALLAPVPATATATPTAVDGDPFPCFFAPSPGSGWVPVASGFSACAPCETVGEAGVSRGDWAHYHCAFVPIGLHRSYWLFVPEAAPLTTRTLDPYVDALAPANESRPCEPDRPPDDRFATVSGRFSPFLVLDLGAGEEGVGDLEVRFHQTPGTLAQSMDVHFLDGTGQDLSQGRLTMIGTGTRTTTVTNPSTPVPEDPHGPADSTVRLHGHGLDAGQRHDTESCDRFIVCDISIGSGATKVCISDTVMPHPQSTSMSRLA